MLRAIVGMNTMVSSKRQIAGNDCMPAYERAEQRLAHRGVGASLVDLTPLSDSNAAAQTQSVDVLVDLNGTGGARPTFLRSAPPPHTQDATRVRCTCRILAGRLPWEQVSSTMLSLIHGRST